MKTPPAAALPTLRTLLHNVEDASAITFGELRSALAAKIRQPVPSWWLKAALASNATAPRDAEYSQARMDRDRHLVSSLYAKPNMSVHSCVGSASVASMAALPPALLQLMPPAAASTASATGAASIASDACSRLASDGASVPSAACELSGAMIVRNNLADDSAAALHDVDVLRRAVAELPSQRGSLAEVCSSLRRLQPNVKHTRGAVKRALNACADIKRRRGPNVGDSAQYSLRKRARLSAS